MSLRLAAWLGAAALVGGLGACAADMAYYGPPPPYAGMDYDAWYDGFYGPFYGGYWGPAGRFYYWDAGHMHYHADVGAHFRREGAAGFNAIHGRSPAPAGAHGPGAPRAPGGAGRPPH